VETQGLHLNGGASVEAWSGKDRADENFPVGSLLISRRLRPHVHAFYAFARNADDIADNPALRPTEKVARLDRMEAVLIGCTDAGAPSALALRRCLVQTGSDPAHARDLLHAFRQDATKTRYASWTELAEYCRYSAVPVGRHMLDLHGEGPSAWAASDALCTALQVLNHLQDAAADLAALGRCYLPAELLDEAGARVEDLRAGRASPALRQVFDRLLDHCDALNRAAAALPRAVRDRRLRVETAMIVGLSRRLAARLRRSDPVAGRVALSRADFALAALAALRRLA
jgi:farnesyl-diphosphate farnesyltransferase